jgi:hypothetical protein
MIKVDEVRTLTVTVGDTVFGEMEVESEWEGFLKLAGPEGDMIIYDTHHECLRADPFQNLFNDIFGGPTGEAVTEDGRYRIICTSPKIREVLIRELRKTIKADGAEKGKE